VEARGQPGDQGAHLRPVRRGAAEGGRAGRVAARRVLEACGAEVPAPAQQDRQVLETHAGQAVHALALAAHAGGQRTAAAADRAHRTAPPHGRDGPAAGLRAAGRRCGGHQRHDCQGRRILQRHNARAYLGIKQVILHVTHIR